MLAQALLARQAVLHLVDGAVGALLLLNALEGAPLAARLLAPVGQRVYPPLHGMRFAEVPAFEVAACPLAAPRMGARGLVRLGVQPVLPHVAVAVLPGALLAGLCLFGAIRVLAARKAGLQPHEAHVGHTVQAAAVLALDSHLGAAGVVAHGGLCVFAGGQAVRSQVCLAVLVSATFHADTGLLGAVGLQTYVTDAAGQRNVAKMAGVSC